MVRVRDILFIKSYSICISPDVSYMYLTSKDKIRICAEAIGAVGVLRHRF